MYVLRAGGLLYWVKLNVMFAYVVKTSGKIAFAFTRRVSGKDDNGASRDHGARGGSSGNGTSYIMMIFR
jgi:hypothetical protein